MSDDRLTDALDEVDTAQNQNPWEASRSSLQGWRDMSGMTLGAAVFVDLVFIMVGYMAWVQPGALHWLGAAAIAIGGLGLLEKIIRRVRA